MWNGWRGIVGHVKDRVVVRNFHRLAVRKDLVDSRHEAGPLAFIVEIVHHQEAAALEVFAQARRLRVGEHPIAHADRVQKRPVEDFVAVDIDNLLD